MTPNQNQSVAGRLMAPLTGVSLMAMATLMTGQADAAQPPAGADPLLPAHLEPLSDAELAAFRGGFVTPHGLEISLGFRLDLDISDRLTLATEFKPQWASPGGKKAPGELLVTLVQKGAPGSEPVSLSIGPNGQVKVLSGNPQVHDIDGGKRYAFEGGVAADVAQGGLGSRVTAGGDLPVVLAQTKDGLELRVGDEATTAVWNRITRGLVSAHLTNRRNDAQISQHLNVDVNLLNFHDTAHLRALRTSSLRVLKLVNGSLIRAMAPR
jgi:hypothetical protein